MKNLLITGALGYLGSALADHFAEKYSLIKVVHNNAKEGEIAVELTNEDEVKDLSKNFSPNYIFHAAGRKAQACEKNPESALVNVLASEFLTKYFSSTPIYFFSSDFVFDGEKGNYAETDSPNPLTIYGKSKLQAEQTYDQNRHCIIRTAGLFDIEQPGFLRYVFSHLSQNKPIEAFGDIYSTPTYLPYFCRYLEEMIGRGLTGLFHVAGRERVSRFEFARLIAKTHGYDPSLVLMATAPEQFLSPRDSSLDSSKIRDLLSLEWPSLKVALEDMCDQNSRLQNEKT